MKNKSLSAANDSDDVRPVLIMYPAIYSLLMLNYLVYKKKIKFAGVVVSSSHIKMKGISFSYLESFYILCRKAGISYALYMFIITNLSSFTLAVWRIAAIIIGKRLYLKSFREIFREQKLPFVKCKDINSISTFNFMKDIRANLIVSAYNNQILKYSVCKKFPYRGINIHNSYLPDFGGLDSAFETLYQGVKESGATIHYVDKTIDTGRIIAQDRLAVYSNDTVFSLNIRQWLRGARILPKVIKLIKKDRVESKKQDLSMIKYPYRSFPDCERVKTLIEKGRRLIVLKDIFIPNSYVFRLFQQRR